MKRCPNPEHITIGRTKDNRCKECRRLSKLKYDRDNADKMRGKKKQWRQNNPEKMKGYGEKWRAENPDKVRNKQLRRYKLTTEQWDNIIKEQGNVCSLCRLPFGIERLLIPVVDHDHSCCNGRNSCGKCVRGIIHYKCNLFISFAGDNPTTLQQGIEYLASKHKSEKS